MSAEEDVNNNDDDVVVVVVLLSPCAHRAVSTFLQTGHVTSVVHLTALQFVSNHNRQQKFPSKNLIAVAPEDFGEKHYVTRVELQSAGSQPLFAAHVTTSKPTRPFIGSFSVFTGVSDTKDPAQVLSFEGEQERESPPTVIFGIKGCSDMCGSNSVSKGVSFALRALLSRKSTTADDQKACDDMMDEADEEERDEVDVDEDDDDEDDEDEDDEDKESEGKVLDDQDGAEDDADDDDDDGEEEEE